MKLSEVTQDWRLFFWLTRDFHVAHNVESERYRIVEIVPGGNDESCVFFVYDKLRSQTLALKVCRDERKLTEDTIIYHLSCAAPNAVVKIYAVQAAPLSSRYRLILMEKGISVKAALENSTLLTAGRLNPIVKRLFCQMAAAVRAVHALGYYHKDLRMENFTCFLEDGELVPRLIDFGLATTITDREWTVNNQEFIRPPEFIYLSSRTPVQQVIYQANHDIYALCMAFMDLLDLRPDFFLTRELQAHICGLYKAELDNCPTMAVRDLLCLAPWQQCIRLIFFFGIPPKNISMFHESPVGRFVARKYELFNLDYLHNGVLTEQLSGEPVLLEMFKHCLDWDNAKRVSSCEQLFELYLDRL